MKIKRSFYQREATIVAPALLGMVLIHDTPAGKIGGIIVETEAYMGAIDPAAHSYKGRTARTDILFQEGGFAYVYLIYGMHCCLNVSANHAGIPHCVLIRAIEPTIGLELMQRNRKQNALKQLANGPGKLCTALDITRAQYGADLCGNTLFIEEPEAKQEFVIEESKRINIDYAGEARDHLWRYTIKDSPYLSR